MTNNEKESKKLKVLCVDDELGVLDLLRSQIAKLGYDTITAKNSSDALLLVQEHQKDLCLIISDYFLINENGFDFRKKLLSEYKQIPFVILSGHITKEMALNAVDLKISAFVEKPFRDEQLSEIIKKECAERVALILEEAELLSGFVADAEMLTEEIESLLLVLEKNTTDIEAINRIFACAHTIKGASGFFRPDYVHKFTHKFEDYFSKFKKNPELLHESELSILLSGLDIIKKLIINLKANNNERIDINELSKIFSSESVELNNASTVTRCSSKPTVLSKEANSDSVKKEEDLRVSMHVLDEFMERSGELTVLRNMINKVVRVIEKENPTNKSICILSDLLGEMHKTNAIMQDKVTDLRKVPLKQVFRPLSRTLRDLCINLKKEISIEFIGDDLRIDHSLAAVLGKCLVHMIRNSADHGIEDPINREKNGKPKRGTIQLKAEENNGEIVIHIKDDGKGINPLFIKKKAIEKGIISTSEADKLSDKKMQLLIFEPGFSTAEQVTDVSGRGVGTDMVMKSVIGIGGRIDIESVANVGTEFIIYLPIPKSVLIISSLLVKSDNEVFGIPQDNIDRIIKTNTEDSCLRKIGSHSYYEVAGKLVPITHLSSILNLTNGVSFKERTMNNSLILICVKSKSSSYCIEVDEIFDIEDTVLKRLGKCSYNEFFFLGATFLGDGRVGLLLNIDGIAEYLKLSSQVESSISKALENNSDGGEFISSNNKILIVELFMPGLFGILQSELFRLEEFSSNSIKTIGDINVVLYRGQSMPILKISNLFKGSKISLVEESEKSKIQTLVLRYQNKFYGIEVKKIIDLVPCGQLKEIADSQNYFSPIILGPSVVNKLNLFRIFENSDISGHFIDFKNFSYNQKTAA